MPVTVWVMATIVLGLIGTMLWLATGRVRCRRAPAQAGEDTGSNRAVKWRSHGPWSTMR